MREGASMATVAQEFKFQDYASTLFSAVITASLFFLLPMEDIKALWLILASLNTLKSEVSIPCLVYDQPWLHYGVHPATRIRYYQLYLFSVLASYGRRF